MTMTAATTGSCLGEEQAWPPGFRFHPTDEELVLYYLKRRICRRKLKLDIIRETDVYKWNPEDLPAQAILKNGDRQWFFFSPRDRKYPNAARTNRTTGHGYWKTTGKDRPVTCNSRTVGVKKTLVFHRGRAPKGERTDWVMHEYTLDEEELKRCQNVKDYYALYKLYKKSGPGPKNGEQYGAPFKEEEWADEECSSKVVDAITPVKQPNEAISNDNVKLKDQIQFPSNDIDDEPSLPQPQAHFDYILPRVTSEEEIQSSLLEPSPKDVLFPKPLEVVHDHATFDFSLSPTSELQLHETPEVTSVPNHFEQIPEICKEDYLDIADYLEMDDLLNSDTLISNVEKPVESGQQFNELDGISEVDMYFDVSTFLQDIGPTCQGTVPFPHAENMINQICYQLEPQSNISLMDRQLQPQFNVTGVDNQLQLQPNTSWDNHQMQSQLNTIGDNQKLPPQSNAFGDNILNQAGYQAHFCLNNLMDQQFIPHSTVDYQSQFHPYKNELEQELPTDEINGSIWTHYQSGDVFSPSGSNLGNGSPTSGMMFNVNNQEQGENGGGTSRFSSVLWSFVDSIPTTPASAAESPLVNRSLERMSSFSKLRINARIGTASAVNGASTGRRRSRNKGFFFISILGALCAILWFLVGMVRVLGSCIS